MYFFIAIIFIAELIIAFTVINTLWKADKAVLKFNRQMIESSIKFIDIMTKARIFVYGMKNKVNDFINYINRKRQEVTYRIIKNILIYLLILIVEIRIKKAGRFKKLLGYGKAFLKEVLA